jgi:ubiquitin thioesterase protein OTUB1
MSNLEENIVSSENTQDNTNNSQPRSENPAAGQEEVKNDNAMSVEEPNQNQNQPQYDSNLIDQQNEEIRKEIEENSPLISDLLPLQMLEFEFSGNQPFLTKIKNLQKKYPDYRKVRRDGSCFYRAFLFRFFEYLIRSGNKDQLDKFIKRINESKKYLMDAGFEEFVIEDFQQALLDQLESLNKSQMSENSALDIFCDKFKSDSLVLYLRFLVSGYLKTNAILYEHFLENGMTMDHFCHTEVEPIDKDADQVRF